MKLECWFLLRYVNSRRASSAELIDEIWTLSFPIGDGDSRFMNHFLFAIFRKEKVLVRIPTFTTIVFQTCAILKSFCNGSILHTIAGNGIVSIRSHDLSHITQLSRFFRSRPSIRLN